MSRLTWTSSWSWTGVVTVSSLSAPSPSWPSVLLPHTHTSPRLVSAMLCAAPALSLVTFIIVLTAVCQQNIVPPGPQSQ